MNGGFERGLEGWKVEGAAKVEGGALVLGPGAGAVRQRYEVPGLRILWFGATLKPSSPGVSGDIRLRCYDGRDRVLLDQAAGPDAKSNAAIYLKTHAKTKYVILSVEKRGEAGTLVADDVLLKDDDRDRVEHPPQIDLDLAMRPIWRGNEVVDESVLLLAQGSEAAAGRLLFAPTRILAVKDSSRQKTFVEGKDFVLEGRTMRVLPGSGLPTMKDSEFEKGEFPWTRLDGRHVFVTYEHRSVWEGPTPTFQGESLPLSTGRLRARRPLTVVAYGDSITLGINVSGFLRVPPYMPPWPALVERQLRNATGDARVNVVNVGLGGMTSQWAKDNARDMVASLDPDLVLIAFGMNDFWSLTPELFRKNIEATMAEIRKRRPKCEFLLISPMKFDPVYTTDPTYVGNHAGYAGEFRKLVGPGVGLFDMTGLSDALYRAKSAKDLATDPMHPNDFLARWYAQGVVAALVKS